MISIGFGMHAPSLIDGETVLSGSEAVLSGGDAVLSGTAATAARLGGDGTLPGSSTSIIYGRFLHRRIQ